MKNFNIYSSGLTRPWPIFLNKKNQLLILLGVLLSIFISCLHIETESSNAIVQDTSNLPIVIIDTFGQWIPDEPKISARMKIIYAVDSELHEPI